MTPPIERPSQAGGIATRVPDDDTAARIALVAAGVAGDPAVAVAIAIYGSVSRFVAAVHDQTDSAAALTPVVRGRIRSLASGARVARIIDQTRHMQLGVVTPNHRAWPAQLDSLRGRSPLVLWVRGETSSLLSPSVSLTGASTPSGFGLRMGLELATGLSGRGWVLVAGAGCGIDELVHRSAIAMSGRTITVSAASLDGLRAPGPRCAQVTELPPGSRATVRSQWRAKHVIAALGSKTIIVEGGLSTGALRTAKAAHEMGRPIGLVDGPFPTQSDARWESLAQQPGVSFVGSIRDADWLS